MSSDQQVKYVSLNNQDENDREEATAPRQGTTATSQSQHQPPLVAQSSVMHQPMMTTPLYPIPLAREYLPQGRAASVYAATRAATTSGMTQFRGDKLKANNVTL